MEMIEISKDEYEELLRIKEYSQNQASIKNKTGNAWNEYQKMKEFDEYCTKTYISYSQMKKDFNKQWKLKHR